MDFLLEPRKQQPGGAAVLAAAAAVAALLWTAFHGAFWTLMTATYILAVLTTFYLRGQFFKLEGFRGAVDLGGGTAAGLTLYALFWVGRRLLDAAAPGLEGQLASLYGVLGEIPAAAAVLLVVLVIAPGEEIFWRGLVQTYFERQWGGPAAVLTAAVLYAAVHLTSGSLVLTAAALAAGLFWGWYYSRTRRVVPVIYSHIIFDVLIMWALPLA